MINVDQVQIYHLRDRSEVDVETSRSSNDGSRSVQFKSEVGEGQAKEQTTCGKQSRVRHKREYPMTSSGSSIDYYRTDCGSNRKKMAGRKNEE
ncbi:hypothetical protein TNIN_140661 [Trichonephila inaurata madagascariensis]|uniref:Uncharacterized protein n=1 Tax=Trichonephila inaurata madagascariensis TaxID=2747483 RepID=A0A8X6YTD0_9ARAC|nr:hypothetical protein TNIN_140661 [Trichonephila inaurata madagascariensis]